MNVKTVMVGFGMLVFIFCSIKPGQAELDPKYYDHFLCTPGEHPWQDSGAPQGGLITQKDIVSPIFFTITPLKVISINPSWAKLSSGKTKITAEARSK